MRFLKSAFFGLDQISGDDTSTDTGEGFSKEFGARHKHHGYYDYTSHKKYFGHHHEGLKEINFKKMNFDENIKKNNIILPEAASPVGSYVATMISNNLLFISGQISIDENGKLIKGKIGKDLNTEAGYNAAKRCALSIVSQVKKACDGDLSKIKSCIKLTGFVNSTDDFTDQPKVLNGASDLIASIFGDAGMHARAAVSTNSLPLGVSVEVDAIFELK